MTPRRAWLILACFAVLLGTAVLGLLTDEPGGWVLGGVVAVVVMVAAAARFAKTEAARTPTDPSRRDFLALAGATGAVAATGGVLLTRAVHEQREEPTIAQAQDLMARDLGQGYMDLVTRGFYAGRSGELQLVVYPFNSANYPPESRSLVRDDPRSSHAAPWLYLERIPLVFYGPGRVAPEVVEDRVSLADVAPTTAALIGSDFDAPEGRRLEHVMPHGLVDGAPADGYRPPKVVVTLVIDGGGWNTLEYWPDAWPNLRRLMNEGTNYTNAIMGSNPAVTACAHATISTGAFPRTHGISGHFIRYPDGRVAKAYGDDGEADTSTILVPTLPEHFQRQTGNKAWVGEIGYQIWHLGMIGNPAGYAGTKPVGVYYDEDRTGLWQSQNPERYRLPNLVPPRTVLEDKLQSYVGPTEGSQFTPKGGASSCCSPPIIEYQGDLIAATLETEPVGQTEATSLLTINYKAPDYAGHIYNMLDPHEEAALRSVDEQIGRLVADLDTRFPGDYVLIVTADHGQCPLVDDAGGVRLDPIQLQADIEERFGRVVTATQDVRPAEIYLQQAAIQNDPQLAARIAAWLRTYTYGENYMQYPGVPHDAIQWDQMQHLEFAGVFSSDYLSRLRPDQIAALGRGVYCSTTDTPISF